MPTVQATISRCAEQGNNRGEKQGNVQMPPCFGDFVLNFKGLSDRFFTETGDNSGPAPEATDARRADGRAHSCVMPITIQTLIKTRQRFCWNLSTQADRSAYKSCEDQTGSTACRRYRPRVRLRAPCHSAQAFPGTEIVTHAESPHARLADAAAFKTEAAVKPDDIGLIRIVERVRHEERGAERRAVDCLPVNEQVQQAGAFYVRVRCVCRIGARNRWAEYRSPIRVDFRSPARVLVLKTVIECGDTKLPGNHPHKVVLAPTS